MRGVWLFLHLAGMFVWMGGMYFAHYCLRPVLATRCEPAQRLDLMAQILGRFFSAVLVAIVLLWVSGIALMSGASHGKFPASWTAMMLIAAVMTTVFAVIRWARYPALVAAVAAAD